MEKSCSSFVLLANKTVQKCLWAVRKILLWWSPVVTPSSWKWGNINHAANRTFNKPDIACRKCILQWFYSHMIKHFCSKLFPKWEQKGGYLKPANNTPPLIQTHAQTQTYTMHSHKCAPSLALVGRRDGKSSVVLNSCVLIWGLGWWETSCLRLCLCCPSFLNPLMLPFLRFWPQVPRLQASLLKAALSLKWRSACHSE